MKRWDKVTPEQRAAQQEETRRIIVENVRRMSDSGIGRVSVVGVGGREDCAACRRITKRKRYAIDELPDIPPADCACVPWCRCAVIAVE